MHAGEDHTRPGWTTSKRGRVNQNERTGRDKWRKYVHMVWPTLGSRTAKEQNPSISHSTPRKNLAETNRHTRAYKIANYEIRPQSQFDHLAAGNRIVLFDDESPITSYIEFCLLN